MNTDMITAVALAAGAAGLVKLGVDLFKMASPGAPSWVYPILAIVLSPIILVASLMAALAPGQALVFDQQTIGLLVLSSLVSAAGAMGLTVAGQKADEKRAMATGTLPVQEAIISADPQAERAELVDAIVAALEQREAMRQQPGRPGPL